MSLFPRGKNKKTKQNVSRRRPEAFSVISNKLVNSSTVEKDNFFKKFQTLLFSAIDSSREESPQRKVKVRLSKKRCVVVISPSLSFLIVLILPFWFLIESLISWVTNYSLILVQNFSVNS